MLRAWMKRGLNSPRQSNFSAILSDLAALVVVCRVEFCFMDLRERARLCSPVQPPERPASLFLLLLDRASRKNLPDWAPRVSDISLPKAENSPRASSSSTRSTHSDAGVAVAVRQPPLISLERSSRGWYRR